jgi:hypothetical protein
MNDDQERTEQRVAEQLSKATRQVLERSRARDYEEADRLLHARGVSFGIGLLVLGTGVIGLAILFNSLFPQKRNIILVFFAFALWAIGGVFIDMPNWLRARLARRLLRRSLGR